MVRAQRSSLPSSRVTLLLVAASALLWLVLIPVPTEALAAATCNGLPATIVGTNGDDVIVGTTGDDVISAKDGNDTVSGKGGDDTICGDDGWDTLRGGFGADILLGGKNGDVLDGQVGPDLLMGQNGHDTLYGRKGNDILVGGTGADTLRGGLGSDSARFGSSATADLQSGSSHLWREPYYQRDTLISIENLIGSPESDDLRGNGKANELSGGGGDDSLNGRGGPDIMRGGPGSDQVLFYEAPRKITASLAAGTATGWGQDTLLGIEDLVGTDHDDTLTGNSADNHIYALDGFDLVSARDGDDDVYGGWGNDTLIGGAGDDYLNGQGRFDTLHGGRGQDYCQEGEIHYYCEYVAEGGPGEGFAEATEDAGYLDWLDLTGRPEPRSPLEGWNVDAG